MFELTVTLFNSSGCDLGSWTMRVEDTDNITQDLINLLSREHITIAEGDTLKMEMN